MPKKDKDPFSFDPKGVFKSAILVVLFFDVVLRKIQLTTK